MKTYTIYTRSVVLGQTTVVAQNETEARSIVVSDINRDVFTPDISIPERTSISNISQKNK